MRIPDSFIQELLSRADCVEVVGRHVGLKKAGANFMGLCPFHGEKTPSFTVSPAKQFYHCFGCGKSGNAIGFLMDHLGLSFIEAVHDLAQQMGIQVPTEQLSPEEQAKARQSRERHQRLSDIMAEAARAYQMQLRATERGATYLKQRGVSGEIAKRFGLGYAPEGRKSLAGVFANYDDPRLVECGLVIEREDEQTGEKRRYDRFRDRVMFPIRNVKGETIGFGGRILDRGEPKYLNSPETPLFSKGRELYGLWEAKDAIRQAGYVLVTEGYMDVVALAQMGFEQVVATLGTACTPEHVHKLFRFTDQVIFSFDGDKAGRRAAAKALDGALAYATDTRSVKFLFLPPEHDPDSFIREFGQEAFGHAVQQATPLSRFMLDSARAGCELQTAEGRAQMLVEAKRMWALLPEGSLRIQLLNELASMAQMSVASLKELWGLHPPAPGATSTKGAFKRYQEYGTAPFNRSQKPGLKAGNERFDRDGLSQRAQTGVHRGGTTSRAERLVQLTLLDHSLLGALGESQLALLTALPGRCGPMFNWLEGQLHNVGTQPWAALYQGLQSSELGVDFADWANQLMNQHASGMDSPFNDGDGEAQKSRSLEFSDIMRRIQIDSLKMQESAAIEAASRDPQALVRYRQLQAERRKLELAAPSKQA